MTTTATSTTKCLRCGRTLSAAKSVADGMGRGCKARVKAAADVINLTAFRDAKAAHDKAIELIEQGGLTRTRIPGQYLATSSTGTDHYLVDTIERSCTCKGHQRVGRCYHLVAADLLTANLAA